MCERDNESKRASEREREREKERERERKLERERERERQRERERERAKESEREREQFLEQFMEVCVVCMSKSTCTQHIPPGVQALSGLLFFFFGTIGGDGFARALAQTFFLELQVAPLWGDMAQISVKAILAVAINK